MITLVNGEYPDEMHHNAAFNVLPRNFKIGTVRVRTCLKST